MTLRSLKKRFSKINIEITNICNLKCSFCPEVIRDSQMMELSVFKKIIKEVAQLTDQVCLHLMGDPLVHPDLGKFISVCSDNNVKIFFVTNGVLLRPDKMEMLLDPTIRQVCFSLHSFADNFPDQNPDNYLEKIFDFTERALSVRPDLYVNFRLWNLQGVKVANSLNLGILKKIEARFETKVSDDIDVRRTKSICLKGRLYIHFDTEFVWPSMDLPVLGRHGTCYGLSSHFGILVDGTVVPCCLDKEAAITLGNLKTQSVLEILSSSKAMAVINGFKRGELVEDLCQRCQYRERFS